MRLNKSEWEKFDQLLSMQGFGGYYDLMECLYTIAGKLISPTLETTLRDNKESLHTTISVLAMFKKKE